MSKSAIDQFTRCVALGESTLFCFFKAWKFYNKQKTKMIPFIAELASKQVRVNAVWWVKLWSYSTFFNFSFLLSDFKKNHSNLFFLFKIKFSPGVIITEVHRRAGLDDDQYAQVIKVKSGCVVWKPVVVWMCELKHFSLLLFIKHTATNPVCVDGISSQRLSCNIFWWNLDRVICDKWTDTTVSWSDVKTMCCS